MKKQSRTATKKKSLLERAIVKSVELTRYAVKVGKPDRNRPVMTTNGEVAFFEKGVTNWRLDLARRKPLLPAKTATPHVEVKAEWLDTQAALERGVRAVHGGSANTFGGMGALLVPDGFSIPTVTATEENVRHYGLQLIPDKTDFAVSSDEFQIVMMRYDYGKDYKKDFLMKKHGAVASSSRPITSPTSMYRCRRAAVVTLSSASSSAAENTTSLRFVSRMAMRSTPPPTLSMAMGPWSASMH